MGCLIAREDPDALYEELAMICDVEEWRKHFSIIFTLSIF